MPIESGGTIKLVADFDRAVATMFIERPLDASQIAEEIDENHTFDPLLFRIRKNSGVGCLNLVLGPR